MEKTKVILVDELDRQLGIAGKMEVHEKGMLHRAFSIFIFNAKGEMLLQRRAMNKYHSSGLWSNACCSHPQPGQDTRSAAEQRLQEEMGFTTPLEKIFDFVYKAEFENGLTEFEFDHVFAGEYDGEIFLDNEEADDHCYKDVREIRKSLKGHPHKYTAWFLIAFPRIEEWWRKRYKAEAV